MKAASGPHIALESRRAPVRARNKPFFRRSPYQYGAVITSGVPKELPRHLTIDGEVIVPQGGNASITYPYEYYDYESRSYHFPVVGIAANAFANCDSLESVSLPNGLMFVEEAAFYGCKNLKQVSGTGNMVGSCNRCHEGRHLGSKEPAVLSCRT